MYYRHATIYVASVDFWAEMPQVMEKSRVRISSTASCGAKALPELSIRCLADVLREVASKVGRWCQTVVPSSPCFAPDLDGIRPVSQVFSTQ